MFILGLLELQLHGSSPRPQHEVRARPRQPQGVLPRGAQTLSLHELCQHRGGRRADWRRRQRGYVCVGADRMDIFA